MESSDPWDLSVRSVLVRSGVSRSKGNRVICFLRYDFGEFQASDQISNFDFLYTGLETKV
jgi:hypothetical protein